VTLVMSGAEGGAAEDETAKAARSDGEVQIKIAAEPLGHRRELRIWVAAAKLPHCALQTNAWSGISQQ
jgi:hypothetical protein